uniref:Uncharacterized protein n=1 Tax=Arundo donax TaxID=35708 RepID=A0A0A9CR67_ARUDO
MTELSGTSAAIQSYSSSIWKVMRSIFQVIYLLVNPWASWLPQLSRTLHTRLCWIRLRATMLHGS